MGLVSGNAAVALQPLTLASFCLKLETAETQIRLGGFDRYKMEVSFLVLVVQLTASG